MYPEYDPNEPTLGQSFADMLRGLKNPQNLQQVGQGIVNTAQLVPNVIESLGRGGVAQAVGTMGDLRDLRNTVQSYLPQSVQNFSNAAEFMTNPYAKALTQTAPTTEQTLDFVPRATAPYEGYKQHETLGEYIAPALGYFGGKALKATKDLPIGMTIQDVTPPIEPAKVAEALRQPEKNALGFYSPLEEAVGNLQNQKGTGQQYLAQLLKTQGVKQEEVATRGLDTFLESNPKVTREQMAQYLRENPVQLKETVLGANSQRDLNTMNYNDYFLDEGRVLDDPDYVSSRADDIAYDYESNNPDIVQMMRENTMKELGFTADDLANPYNEAKFQQKVNDSIYEDSLKQAEEEYRDNPFMEHTDELGYRVTGNDDMGYDVIDPTGNPINYRNNGSMSLSEAEEAIREHALDRGYLHMEEDELGTKYHDYTLPNGENYREVLIQYDPKLSYKDSIRELTPEDKQRLGVDTGVLAKVKDTWGYYPSREVAEMQLSSRLPKYESGHFDEPNILAHFRTTDRTIDGKKTLFVEEIQSDWHQAGRKKGYEQDVKPLQETYDKLAQEQHDYLKEMYKKYSPYATDPEKMKMLDTLPDSTRKMVFETLHKQMSPTEIEKYETLFNQNKDALKALQEAKRNTVPDAPFKKNWQELAMKRAMQMAAEGGYDRVAFTTGKQQADRYSLSKQISEIHLSGTDLVAYDNNGNAVIKQTGVTKDNLADYIGKEPAQKLLEQKPQGTLRSLSGVDLDVGGEGMKGFYDKILPDFINKYGKKHGLKVGQTNLKSRGIPDASLVYETAQKYGYSKQQFDRLPLEEQKKIRNESMPKGEQVHYFDLTPQAKESFLKKGQPMFAVAPAMAITDEDSRRDILEQLFNKQK